MTAMFKWPCYTFDTDTHMAGDVRLDPREVPGDFDSQREWYNLNDLLAMLFVYVCEYHATSNYYNRNT